MNDGYAHLRIDGPCAADLDQDGRRAVRVSCHRRLRGPYTGLGSLLRALVPAIHAADPALAVTHRAEILAIAPELHSLLGPPPVTLTSAAPPQERTRWYSRLRARRFAHGVVDLLRAYDEPLDLSFDAVSEADPTDQEFLALAVRRLDPSRVRLVVACQGGVTGELRDALRDHARQMVPPVPALLSAELDPVDLARAFVDSDGTLGDPRARAAYAELAADARARLHDDRADVLTAMGELSLTLGAIPYHRLRGSDPGQAGWAAASAAADYCLGEGFYEAALERLEELGAGLDFATEPERYYQTWYRAAQCLGHLDRTGRLKPIYDDLLAHVTHPQLQMALHYALSMLYTRLYEPGQKDHRLALGHANTAVAIASLLPEPDNRAFHTAFMRNGRALVTMHLGDLTESLALVDDAIARLDRELRPGEQLLHRSVLHHNRGQLLTRLGRPAEAMAEYDTVIALDPLYPEYWFDRGNLHYDLGKFDAALADYDEAARLGPPFPELHHNRAGVLAAAGDIAGAIAGYRYVLDLEPSWTDASVCLASLLVDDGQPELAIEQARSGLRIQPAEPRLNAIAGLALMNLNRAKEADEAFAAALDADAGNQVALVNRAVLACEQGQPEVAIEHLRRALANEPDNPVIAYNLGFAHEAAGRISDAIDTYTLAMSLDGADQAGLLERLGTCRATLIQDRS